jgi:hypothetical protein
MGEKFENLPRLSNVYANGFILLYWFFYTEISTIGLLFLEI